MEITCEGHIRITPAEVCERLAEPGRLINDILIAGTPRAFLTYEKYCNFLASCAGTLGIHPRNLLIRGSTNIGFSLSPHADRVWVEMQTDSDLDLAIIDPDYYHYIDREIRIWERRPESKAFQGRELNKSIARRKQRAFYIYRYFDLPPIGCVGDQIGCVGDQTAKLKALPVEETCGIPRTIDAFIFRDWWSLYSRWEHDLRDLRKALENGVPGGGKEPRKTPDL